MTGETVQRQVATDAWGQDNPDVRTLGTRPWFEGRVMISGAAKVFDSEGRVADAAAENRIRTFVEGLPGAAVRRGGQPRAATCTGRAATSPSRASSGAEAAGTIPRRSAD